MGNNKNAQECNEISLVTVVQIQEEVCNRKVIKQFKSRK